MKLLKSSLMAVVLGYVLALKGAASAQENNNLDAVAEENFESADADGNGALIATNSRRSSMPMPSTISGAQSKSAGSGLMAVRFLGSTRMGVSL